jgi:hypothetical protein
MQHRRLVTLSCFAWLALTQQVASAAPPTVIQVDVDLEKLDRESDLKFSESEPIGLAVTVDGGRYWQQIGCKTGDLLRDGKPVLLRVVVHGPQLRTVHLTASDAADVVERVNRAGAGEIAIPLKHAQGVRVIESRLDSGLELRPGDIVLAVGEQAIASEADLVDAMKNIAAGHTNVTLRRDGRRLTVTWEREPDVP